MSIEQFFALTQQRVPTPREFLDFVGSQGWRIEARADGTASLKTPPSDPLAQALARMLGREPYRTEVLALVPRPEAPAAPAASAPRVRQWRWRGNLIMPDAPYDHGRTPPGATHWRYVGETEWKEVAR